MDSEKGSLARRLWPVWVAIGMPLVLIIFEASPLAPNFGFVMIGIPAFFFAWACLGIWALIKSVRRLMLREWSQALASAVLPVVILVAGLQFWSFMHLCSYCGDVVHFVARRSSYLQQVRSIPPDGEPRLMIFNRGGMIWASRGYVYDESDEVLRAEALRSAGWKARADQTELTCGYFAQPFPGHFSLTRHWYIASFNC
jgi:hypothetical protein